jgi:hypothetical protein
MKKEDLANTEKDYNQAVLLLLQNNSLFKDEFIKFSPENEADIQSASVNKNCSCRNKIINFINNNKEKFNDFLYDFLIRNDLLISFIEYLNSSPVYKNYSGKVAKTSISEWENFTQNIIKDNASFRNFSVIKDGDDILVFFL